MNKDTILALAPHVIKRMEYGIDIFFLLNFENDDIWSGNYTSYLIINSLNGKDTIEDIVNSLLNGQCNFSYDELFNATINILEDLLEQHFLIQI